jgi:phosphoglycolate phosphatase
VVTNKPAFLTDPLMQALQLTHHAATIVSGDTLAQRKPDPAPMHHAAQQAGSLSSQCLYIGDANRDIEAGRRAGMKTVAALFGYIESDNDPATWGADMMIHSPMELIPWIDQLNQQHKTA